MPVTALPEPPAKLCACLGLAITFLKSLLVLVFKRGIFGRWRLGNITPEGPRRRIGEAIHRRAGPFTPCSDQSTVLHPKSGVTAQGAT